MLNKIKLTNFRRHTDATFTFTQGLNVLRAANENGKTTLLEAVAYAFFGTKALRTSLDDAVSWGEELRTLKVELDVTVGGRDLTFVRSKNGAEVRAGDQVLVNGQNEVSVFAAKMLNADLGLAQQLMLAGQMGLRGILTAGPKATGALIEDLGNFDLFDRILDAAQAKLSLGSTAGIDARIEQFQKERDAIVVPARPDANQYAKTLSDFARQREERVGTKEANEGVKRALSQTVLEEKMAASKATGLIEQISNAEQRALDLDAERTKLQQAPEAGLIDVEGIDDEITAERAAVARWEAYSKLPVQTYESVSREVATQRAADAVSLRKENDAGMQEARVDIARAEAQLVTSSVCGFCDQDISQFPSVKAKNDGLRGNIQKLELAVENYVRSSVQLDEIEAQHRSINEADEAIKKIYRDIDSYAKLDESVIPARIEWVGDVPVMPAPSTLKTLFEKRAAAIKHNEDEQKRKSRIAYLTETIGDYQAQLITLRETLATIKVMTADEMSSMERQIEVLEASIASESNAIHAIDLGVAQAKADFTAGMTAHENAASLVARLDEHIKQGRAEKAELEFNNNLVNKIRKARPVVGDKLWSMVLTSVSTVFSALRGERSLVARAEKGFTVNGQNIESLSGSTLDLLGLAIRVALIKTFIPGCPLLVLDEPGASMDLTREGLMLAYLQTCGFDQIVLVTHSDLSESVAQNLITF